MSNNRLKNNILKFGIIPFFALCMVFLVGCNTSKNNTITNLSSNMDKIIDTITGIETIKTSELIINDFMNEDELIYINSESIPALYEQTDAMNMYFTKIANLNNSIFNVNQINNELNNFKIQIVAKAHEVKSLCDQTTCTLSKNSQDNLEEINNMVMANNTRANLTKNEVKNNLKLVNELKNDYSIKPEILSSRYLKLEGSLTTRLTYYKNILSGLFNIGSVLIDNSSCNDYMTLEETDETKNFVENDDNFITETSSKNNGFFKKNIDTYENAGKDFNGFNRNYNNNENGYNNYIGNNYYNNPNFMARNGYGYGYNGGIGYGYGMPYGNNIPYGMGMPYGYGGFTYPNINTYGIYKNIDTYKPLPKNKQYEEDVQNDTKDAGNTDDKNIDNCEEQNETTIYNDDLNKRHKKPKFLQEEIDNKIKDFFDYFTNNTTKETKDLLKENNSLNETANKYEKESSKNDLDITAHDINGSKETKPYKLPKPVIPKNKIAEPMPIPEEKIEDKETNFENSMTSFQTKHVKCPNCYNEVDIDIRTKDIKKCPNCNSNLTINHIKTSSNNNEDNNTDGEDVFVSYFPSSDGETQNP